MGEASVGRLKGFAAGTFRLAVAITLALVVLAAIFAAGYWVYSTPERQQVKAAEAVRNWAVDLSSNLGMKLKARTKVADGRMLTALDFDGYPEFLKQPRNRQRGFNLEWKDADGFTRFRKFVPLSDFSTSVNSKGQPYGLTGELSEFVAVADYAALAHLEVGWTFETDASPTSAAVAQPATPATSDHCAPGLSRQERMRRLAQHGTLRETGYNTFSAGEHTLTLSGAEVVYCS